MSLEEVVCALRDTKEGPLMLAALARRIAAIVEIDGIVSNGRLFCFLCCIYSCLLTLYISNCQFISSFTLRSQSAQGRSVWCDRGSSVSAETAWQRCSSCAKLRTITLVYLQTWLHSQFLFFF